MYTVCASLWRPLSQGRHVLEIIEAGFESMKTGRVVELKTDFTRSLRSSSATDSTHRKVMPQRRIKPPAA